jgi:hypothetical protein
MLYPAPNAAGLLAAIITHGILAESQKNQQKEKMQQEADAVLEPFQPVLGRFMHRELMQKALDKVRWGNSRQLLDAKQLSSGWLVEAAPRFAMTQDRRALVLDNLVNVFRPGETDKPAFQTGVRVVSRVREAASVPAVWSEADGAALREESVNLFAHSLELALQSAGRPAHEAAFRTMRYREGEAEKMERAQPLARFCERQVVVTLRGALMSVPSEAVETAAEGCKPALPDWR